MDVRGEVLKAEKKAERAAPNERGLVEVKEKALDRQQHHYFERRQPF